MAIGSSTILRYTLQDNVDEHFQKQLFESALRDGLTRTFNRRYFLDRRVGSFGLHLSSIERRPPLAPDLLAAG